MSALISMFGVLMIVKGLLSFHNFIAEVAGVGERVGEVQGLHVIAHVAAVQPGPLANGAHKLVLCLRVRVIHHVGVQVLGA